MNIILTAAIIIYGTVTAINGGTITMHTCDGDVTVDAVEALSLQKSVPLSIGKNVVILGEWNGNVFKAEGIANKRYPCPE